MPMNVRRRHTLPAWRECCSPECQARARALSSPPSQAVGTPRSTPTTAVGNCPVPTPVQPCCELAVAVVGAPPDQAVRTGLDLPDLDRLPAVQRRIAGGVEPPDD